jgi:hypothetical protein
MRSNPALWQQVLTTYQTTFCEMPRPHTFPSLATARKIFPSVTLAARVHWSRVWIVGRFLAAQTEWTCPQMNTFYAPQSLPSACER